jgi:hypothetical protein
MAEIDQRNPITTIAPIVPCVYCLSRKPLYNAFALCCTARMIVETPAKLRRLPLSAMRRELKPEVWAAFRAYYEALRDER